MLGEFLLSGPLWPHEPQGVSLSDFPLFSAPQSAGTPWENASLWDHCKQGTRTLDSFQQGTSVEVRGRHQVS